MAKKSGFTQHERTFHALQADIFDQINVLKCAWYALEASAAVDADTPASEARSVIFTCEQKLREFHDDLDRWDLNRRPRLEVVSG